MRNLLMLPLVALSPISCSGADVNPQDVHQAAVEARAKAEAAQARLETVCAAVTLLPDGDDKRKAAELCEEARRHLEEAIVFADELQAAAKLANEVIQKLEQKQ